jgi:hypothetical protein
MGEQHSDQGKEPADQGNGDRAEPTPTEKPEPDDKAKEKAAEMMTAYQDRPTLVLPGTGGAVSGTAVNDWLDEDGNPKYANDKDAPAAKAKAPDDETASEEGSEEQIEKDKAFNEAALKAANEAEEKASADEESKAKAAKDEKAVTT